MNNRIESLREQLESLEDEIKKTKFISEFNHEEALDEIASAIISLDDLEDALDRDVELGKMQAVVDGEE